MRNPNYYRLAALVAGVLAACGPSSKEIAGAKSAHYKGDKLEIFHGARAAAEAKYKIDKSDENTLAFETIGRWYSPEGLMAAEGNSEKSSMGHGYNSQYPDQSINIKFYVTMVADGDAWVVQVKPELNRYHVGSPQPEPLTEDDISVPGWVHGKLDAMAFDIHDALKQYEVKSVPGSVPPPTAPAPAPTAPAPAADPAAPPAAAQ